MNFRQIESFRAVMSYGSATQAAEAMHISQPAVSRLIADFEAALGIRLFERERGRLKPTAEAHLLFQESSIAFSGLARLSEAATSIRKLRRGRIRIASETVYAEGFIPRLAAAYQLGHPEVLMELDTGPSSRIPEWVAQSWYELGLVVLPVPQGEVAVHFLRRQQALCALPRGHRFAGEPMVKLKDLARDPFIAPVAGTPYRSFFDRALKAAGVEPDIRFEVRTQHGIRALVAAGSGVALVDPCVAEDVSDDDVHFAICDPQVHWDIALVVSKARSPSLICKDFMEYLISSAA